VRACFAPCEHGKILPLPLENVLLFIDMKLAYGKIILYKFEYLEIKLLIHGKTGKGDAVMRQNEMDEIDRKILRTLSHDGRISNQKLAEAVNLSPTPCWNRVRALEEAGFITQYVALLDQRALGLPDTVIIEVTLDRHDDEIFQRFGDALAQLPEVMEAYLLTGEYDYLIKVAVSGTEGYEQFLRQKLYKIPGIRHSRSTFALRCLKRVHSVTP
jgi:Lrp/AsnC family leucine-responsive transcriptional regulator